jgi:hypothetical protein
MPGLRRATEGRISHFWVPLIIFILIFILIPLLHLKIKIPRRFQWKAGRCLWRRHWFFNPKGIASFSPGSARFREGLPWVAAFNFHNPEGVEYQRLIKQIQPLQGCDFFLFSPRVARGAQPWAECFNPVGIENPCRHPKHLSRYSTENVEEPPLQHQLAQARSIYRIVLCFVVACCSCPHVRPMPGEMR